MGFRKKNETRAEAEKRLERELRTRTHSINLENVGAVMESVTDAINDVSEKLETDLANSEVVLGVVGALNAIFLRDVEDAETMKLFKEMDSRGAFDNLKNPTK